MIGLTNLVGTHSNFILKSGFILSSNSQNWVFMRCLYLLIYYKLIISLDDMRFLKRIIYLIEIREQVPYN